MAAPITQPHLSHSLALVTEQGMYLDISAGVCKCTQTRMRYLYWVRTKSLVCVEVLYFFYYSSNAFPLQANPVQFNTFPVCARDPTSGALACALINTHREEAW